MNKPLIVNPGDKYNSLTVIKEVESRFSGRHKIRVVRCQCDCGSGEREYQLCHLRSGHTKSCGCELLRRATRHGMSDSRPYTCWSAMLSRCTNPNNQAYRHYGGRGITVCDEWRTFNGFWRDMGASYEDGLEIDRINNNDGYYKGNCRWANRSTQLFNRRCNNKIYPGVNKHKNGYTATIMVMKKQHYLGYFKDIGEAIRARMDAEIEYFGQLSRPDALSPMESANVPE